MELTGSLVVRWNTRRTRQLCKPLMAYGELTAGTEPMSRLSPIAEA